MNTRDQAATKKPTASQTIILIDDERAMRESIRQWLTLANFQVIVFDNGLDAINTLKPDFDGIVVTDLKMPNLNGLEVIKAIQDIDSEIPVMLITGHGDVDSAVKAMQLGAYDFIEKPFEPERLISTVNRALEKRHLVIQNRSLRQQVNSAPYMQRRIIGDSPIMQQLRKEIAEVAQIDINVLLIGQTGTGKEVVAQCLHDFGTRAGKPFHAIDCGILPGDGLETDLFGTTTPETRPGQIEQAHGGTLMLDGVLNMPPEHQVKLLRVLQSGEVRPVGGTESTAVDVRVVSAVSEDLQNAVKEERFRSDLYFRLNTIELTIPPLRERGDDVIELFEHFSGNAAQSFDRELPTMTNTDITSLRTHTWPGNVRELKNTAERFVLFQTKRIDDLLDESQRKELHRDNLHQQVSAFERSMIEFAMNQCEGNIASVCKQLGIPRRTLNDKLLKYEIDRTKPSPHD